MSDLARRADAAVRALTLPALPVRPGDTLAGLNAEERQALLDQHAEYDRARAAYDAALWTYQEQLRAIERTFAEDLAAAYLPGCNPATQARVFTLAWTQGHSDGYHEVQSQYEALAGLIQGAFDDARVTAGPALP